MAFVTVVSWHFQIFRITKHIPLDSVCPLPLPQFSYSLVWLGQPEYSAIFWCCVSRSLALSLFVYKCFSDFLCTYILLLCICAWGGHCCSAVNKTSVSETVHVLNCLWLSANRSIGPYCRWKRCLTGICWGFQSTYILTYVGVMDCFKCMWHFTVL